ncbi:MAG: MATE family efflux transporter [Lachnospiraceae bacterium]|nr:MATE family efflux transporter [Lachnospiraceae bacterium]MDY3301836.1 MATE family efflux transporter [Lachnospiraceae bacterium]MEE3432842.1 MATE family efflux transporter [Lachnospiraceae bacterium]
MQTDLTKGSPLKVILKFVLPLFIGNVFQQFYNMVDTIIVGHYVGADALAAVGSTGSIMFLIFGLTTGLSVGFTVLTSQRYGAKDTEGVKISVANGVLLALVVTAIVTSIFLIIMHPLLRIMNTPADIYDYSYDYIIAITWGIICAVFYNLLSAFLRAVGNSTVPLFFLIFSAFVNVGLDLLFIIRFHMGVAGAAWATNASQAISAILCAVYIFVKEKELVPERRMWRIHAHATKFQLTVGIPMSLQFAITASGVIVAQTAINLFGATAIAAFTAANKVHNLVTQGMLSMGQAVATYAGQNMGAGKARRISDGVRSTMLAMAIYSIVVGILVVLLLRPMLSLFFDASVNLDDMMPWAKTYIYQCAIFYIPLSYIFIFRNTMQGCGYGVMPMLGGVVELVCRVAVALIAMRCMNYPLAAFCDPAAWLGAAIFTGVAYIFVIKKVYITLGETWTLRRR